MVEDVQGEGFVVRDLRREEETSESGVQKETEKTEEKASQGSIADEIDFPMFVLSLGSSVILNFGEVPDPVTGKKEKNLPMAKQTIAILSILQDKTKGNLTEDEAKLLENLLADLRMQYISLTEKG